jgi:hypothetical protein
MYIYNFLLRTNDNMISQNTDLSTWDTLYIGKRDWTVLQFNDL